MKKFKYFSMILAIQAILLLCNLFGQGNLVFIGTPTSGTMPLTVQFTITTYPPGNITSALWIFGDNFTSDQLNPTHTYTQPGVYTVRLTVNTDVGQFFRVRNNYITVNATTQSIFVVTPNGGENWEIESTHNIMWTSSNLSDNVKIEISRNSGTSYDGLTNNTPNDGSYSWVVIGPLTTQARIKITSIYNNTVYDISDSDFMITTGSGQTFTFQYEVDKIPVITNGIPLESPFTGGFTDSKLALSDIDNDGDLDLFMGDADGNINFFRNIGSPTNFTFKLETEKIISIDVGDYSAPILTDIDNDSDLDLFVGEKNGNINFYRNTGNVINPEFKLVTEYFAIIDIGDYSTPFFADIDVDNDKDLLVGEASGNINFYRNTGTPTNPAFTLETENLASIKIGFQSAPSLVDIDSDGDYDLFVGDGSMSGGGSGKIHFYRNVGNAISPVFTFETDNFSTIDVGYSSAPIFADLDKDGDFDLIVGEDSGNINYYRNTGTNKNPIYILETEELAFLDVGYSSIPAFTDIDNDHDSDLFIGESDGNIIFYRNTGTARNPIFTFETQNFITIVVGKRSAPTFIDIDNDSDFDLFVGEYDGNINFYRNIGNSSIPIFTLETENFASIDIGTYSVPTLADIDNDGDFDLFVGNSDRDIYFYRNTGSSTKPIFTFETQNLVPNYSVIGAWCAPKLVDINDDGDLDLFVGSGSTLGMGGGNITFYRNTGTASNYVFTTETGGFASIDVGDYSAPTFVDIEKDGDYDLFVGERDGGLNFYRNIQVLIAPTLVLPSNGAANLPITLTFIWNSSPNAVTYHLQISEDISFSMPIFDDSTITATSKQVGPFANNTTYYWRVKAKKVGITSAWSSPLWSFKTIIDVPPAPTLVSPINGALNQPITLTLRWNTSSGAATYRLQVSLSPTFATTIVNDSTITTTYRQTGPLVNNMTYYWRMNAKNAGGTSAWSSIWSFTTCMAIPLPPTLASPPDGSTGIPMRSTLFWNASSGAVSYRLQVSTSSTFSTTVVNQFEIKSTSRLIWEWELINNTKYYWRVSATNAGGASNWSSTWSFTTAVAVPLAPTLISPANNSTNQLTNLILNWNTATNAVTYHLQVSENATFTTYVVNDSTLTTISRQIGPLANRKVYHWRVRAKNAGGNSSWSSVWNFTTIIRAPSTPVLSTPANGAMNQPISLILSWNLSIDAEMYHIQVSTDSNFTVTILNDSTIKSLYKRINDLNYNTLYYWRASAKNIAGTCDWSIVWNFKTIIAAPPTPTLISPNDNSINQPIDILLKWNPSPTATTYRLQVATNSEFLQKIIDDSTITMTSYLIGPLISSTNYYWRVNAKNVGGTSEWSSRWQFKTIIAAPSVPTRINPVNNSKNLPTSLTLKWTNASGAENYHLQVSFDSIFNKLLVNDSTIIDTLYQLDSLKNKTKYHWHVRTQNIGGLSPWSSPVWDFTTIVQLPNQVSLVSPIQSEIISADTVRFIWRRSQPEIIKYWFELSNDSLFSNPQIDSTISDTTYQISTFMKNQSYWWRVKAQNAAGWGMFREKRCFKIVETEVKIIDNNPLKFKLFQNYPNPFNPSTTIHYTIPNSGHVNLTVYDLLGKKIEQLVNIKQPAGDYEVKWDTVNLPNGIYIYKLVVEDFIMTRKAILMK